MWSLHRGGHGLCIEVVFGRWSLIRGFTLIYMYIKIWPFPFTVSTVSNCPLSMFRQLWCENVATFCVSVYMYYTYLDDLPYMNILKHYLCTVYIKRQIKRIKSFSANSSTSHMYINCNNYSLKNLIYNPRECIILIAHFTCVKLVAADLPIKIS